MADKPLNAVKLYENSPFVLTDRKLSRVVEVAKERLERITVDQKYDETHEVRFKNGKELRINSLENVLTLDNSKKNPITRLGLTLEVKSGGETLHGIQVIFDATELYRYGILIQAESKDLGWVQESMGALEEQVERAIPNDLVYSIKRRLGIFSAAIVLVILLSLSIIAPANHGLLRLPEDRIASLVALSNSAKSETEKIDFVFKYLSMTLEEDTTPAPAKGVKSYRKYFIGVPILIGVFSAIAAIIWFYPSYIFAWGDCGESYETTVARRKVLWYGVVLSLVIGVLGNLFVVGAIS
jgi:hypothetical protein